MAAVGRRKFIKHAASAGLVLTAQRKVRAASANSTVVLALMGANGRGSELAKQFAERSDVRIAYVCDPDEKAIKKGIDTVRAQGAPPPKGVRDFRRALEDKAVDAIVCAAPNHWHAAATVMACSAGKHVYLEKPCSHTAEEGEFMVSTVKRTGRIVQVGTQRRSGPLYRTVFEKVRAGAIGDVLYAKAWYFNKRPSIGIGKKTTPPSGLDYTLWQGPAPEQAYQDNVVHYNWHWFWRWGNGELGNNGVHMLDLCRWIMGVDYPSRVTVVGAPSRYKDDQQTPATTLAHYECDGKQIIWEGLSWSYPYQTGGGVGVEFRGTDGTLVVNDSGYKIYDKSRKLADSGDGSRGDREHLGNFLDGIRDHAKLNVDILEGHKSALFCHLGNISYQCGRSLNVDSSNGHFLDDKEASAYWGCKYRPGWNLQELV